MDARTDTAVAWKVTIDRNVCQGYACCVMAVPSVFDLNAGTGRAVVVTAEPAGSLRSADNGVARGCPVHAIRLEGL